MTRGLFCAAWMIAGWLVACGPTPPVSEDTLLPSPTASPSATPTYSPIVDPDGDGYILPDDCQESDPLSYPGAKELCDAKDNDCDGDVDEGLRGEWYPDLDGDGFGAVQSPIVTCVIPPQSSGVSGDCQDWSSAVYPGADEVCDGIDNDCDGSVDEILVYGDEDEDGYGEGEGEASSCPVATGMTALGGDCDGGQPAVHPGAREVCDGVDQDCNGVVDDVYRYQDLDQDGYGSNISEVSCEPLEGFSSLDGDCDDLDADIHPSAEELCNEVDDDCNGQIDEQTAETWYFDNDGDGFGDAAWPMSTCTPPPRYVTNAEDCRDDDASIYPGADERCDGVDTNCDGTVDDGAQRVFYRDADQDGFGDPAVTIQACQSPDGYGWADGDCDDGDAARHPGALEVPDGQDNNCTGEADEEVQLLEVAAGGNHTLLRTSDGAVFALGCNDQGQLGDGTWLSSSQPVQVLGLHHVVQVSAGRAHSLALRAEEGQGTGQVWTWGDNSQGALGTDENGSRALAAPLEGLEGVLFLSAGDEHNLAVTADLGQGQQVVAWGNNQVGQLGRSSSSGSSLPLLVDGLKGVVSVAAGGYHSLALVRISSGAVAVMAWGSNSYGQLGDGTFADRSSPGQVPGVTGLEGVAAGRFHSLLWGLDSSRETTRVYAFGRNDAGQLGDGTTVQRGLPVALSSFCSVVAMEAGEAHSLALCGPERVVRPDEAPATSTSREPAPQTSPTSSGLVYAWGSDAWGQLGNGTEGDSWEPVPVMDVVDVTGIAAGGLFSGAVDGVGALWAWGYGYFGQVGRLPSGYCTYQPQAVAPLPWEG